MNPTDTATGRHQRDALIDAAAGRRAQLVEQSVQPRTRRLRAGRRSHLGLPVDVFRAWLAVGQL